MEKENPAVDKIKITALKRRFAALEKFCGAGCGKIKNQAFFDPICSFFPSFFTGKFSTPSLISLPVLFHPFPSLHTHLNPPIVFHSLPQLFHWFSPRFSVLKMLANPLGEPLYRVFPALRRFFCFFHYKNIYSSILLLRCAQKKEKIRFARSAKERPWSVVSCCGSRKSHRALRADPCAFRPLPLLALPASATGGGRARPQTLPAFLEKSGAKNFLTNI